ncbi:MAG: glycosyltransferase family 2 protein [Microgenomates group bacterium]
MKNNIFSVSVVIPNWNGVYLMEKHLKKTIEATPNAEIIVSDDVSADGSVEYLKKNFPDVIVVANKKRQGFAGNVNSGVARATGDIVILLNTDVEPEKGYLAPLLTHFEDVNVFAVGCLEKSWEHEKTILRGRGVAKWRRGYYIHERGEVDKTDTAWVSGGSGAFRRVMWNTLGGMDTLFNPFYWEDIDLSYRARKAGWNIVFEPKSIVGHYHEVGVIKKEYTTRDVQRISFRNQFTFIWKNLSEPSILASHIFWTPIRLLQALFRGDLMLIQGYVLAMLRYPLIVAKRQKQSKLWKVSDRIL